MLRNLQSLSKQQALALPKSAQHWLWLTLVLLLSTKGTFKPPVCVCLRRKGSLEQRSGKEVLQEHTASTAGLSLLSVSHQYKRCIRRSEMPDNTTLEIQQLATVSLVPNSTGDPRGCSPWSEQNARMLPPARERPCICPASHCPNRAMTR